MSRFLVRKARLEDVGVIAGFNQSMAMETEGKRLDDVVIGPGVKAMLENPQRGFYLIVEVGQLPVACLMVTYEWSDWRNGMFWWIQGVNVIKDFRRQGIYRRMYEHLKQLAITEGGVCGFRLYAENDNQRAHATYRAMGMDQCHYQMFEELV